MKLETLNLFVHLFSATTVLGFVKIKWIQAVAVAELILSILLTLIVWQYLRFPVDNVETILTIMIFAGWAPVLFVSSNKRVIVTATLATWVSLLRFLTELGWVRVDAIRHLLNW